MTGTAITPIARAFADARASGKTAFMPFITAGDPDMRTTIAIVRELASRGVDLIEVGFPYSDPIADGPVIQASYTRALEKGLHVNEIFTAFKQLREETDAVPPLAAMVSYAIVFRVGVAQFLDRAKEAGFAGLIVPDLPGDESDEFAEQVQSRGLDLIQLVAPTTPPARMERILKCGSGFVYCIAVAGTTGERDTFPPELKEHLRRLRGKTDLPLAVGFGVSRPEQIEGLRGLADGVIVGSAVVRKLESLAEPGCDVDAVVASIGEFAAAMVDGG